MRDIATVGALCWELLAGGNAHLHYMMSWLIHGFTCLGVINISEYYKENILKASVL